MNPQASTITPVYILQLIIHKNNKVDILLGFPTLGMMDKAAHF
jgi:hypothetical protein